ncbi:MAG: RsmE family RNA methyltransferase, partial [Gallionella sp.]
MPRFYCPAPIPYSGNFDLPADAAHHAARVLRLRVGDAVEIFDGQGTECHGVIADLTGKRVVLAELQVVDAMRESPLHTVLGQALCSREKMAWIRQKATELGVNEIQPLDTERSVARLSAERAEKRM